MKPLIPVLFLVLDLALDLPAGAQVTRSDFGGDAGLGQAGATFAGRRSAFAEATADKSA